MKKIIDLCKEVPLLPLTILAAIPLALIPQWRPWGHIHPAFDPGVGEWIIILFVAWTIYTSIREMIESIRHGHVGVDLLAIVALISTVCVQQYWASWAVVLMVASGEAIESYAQNKARGNLTALIKAAPQQAHVVTLPGATDGGDTEMTEEGFRKVQQAVEQAQREGKPINMGNGHFDTVPVNDVKLGSVLIVLPGEIVPVDGQLLSGTASVDLSNINGEPVPRTLFAGAKVLSGSINGSTTMMLRTTSLAADSQYQQILKLVSSAEESRAAVVRTADMLAVPFTIISFAIAIVAWIVSGTGLRFAQAFRARHAMPAAHRSAGRIRRRHRTSRQAEDSHQISGCAGESGSRHACVLRQDGHAHRQAAAGGARRKGQGHACERLRRRDPHARRHGGGILGACSPRESSPPARRRWHACTDCRVRAGKRRMTGI